VSLSKVKQAQLGCSSLMFAIGHLCPKRDQSVRCALDGDRAVVIVLFLHISTGVCIGITVADSPGAFLEGSGPTRFEADN
jgi:hypothetical protein